MSGGGGVTARAERGGNITSSGNTGALVLYREGGG